MILAVISVSVDCSPYFSHQNNPPFSHSPHRSFIPACFYIPLISSFYALPPQALGLFQLYCHAELLVLSEACYLVREGLIRARACPCLPRPFVCLLPSFPPPLPCHPLPCGLGVELLPCHCTCTAPFIRDCISKESYPGSPCFLPS